MPEDVSNSVQFNTLSWVIIVGYLLLTTYIGHRLSRKQLTMRDFFLGGHKLPWWAVCGSFIATELSAMTLVSAPAFLWAVTGNMTYASLAIGTILARVIVGIWIIPKYYEKEIYSPYEYIGNQLGMRANRLTSVLFVLGGIMGQGTRVLLTAVVLQVVTGMNIYTAIWLVGATAVLWTAMGGMITVVWTDVVQFLILTFSAVLTLIIVVTEFKTPDGQAGIGTIFSLASEAGKLKWLDLTPTFTKSYTLWAALVGATIGGLAAYGTDQMMIQRCFCCRDARQARKAMIWSSASQVLMLACLFAGVGLWAYYQKSGIPGVPNPDELAQINENADRLLPVFIKYRVPWFFGGLMVAGIFAAAISSLDSILAALSQQTMAALENLRPGRADSIERHRIRAGRWWIVFWAVVLCGMASVFHANASRAHLLIELALSVVGYVSGAILGTFLIAAIPRLRREALGLEWAAALSVMTIFAITRHEAWAPWTLGAACVAVLLTAGWWLMHRDRWAIFKLLPFVAFIIFVNMFQFTDSNGAQAHLQIGWPWYAPLGCLIMLTSSMIICPPKSSATTSQA
jgi:SSS family solute:Na+ symporter